MRNEDNWENSTKSKYEVFDEWSKYYVWLSPPMGLFWFVVMSLLSSWDEMDVCVKLLADDVWAAEDNKTGFLSVGVDSFDRLYLKERPISLPMVPVSTINRKYEKWG